MRGLVPRIHVFFFLRDKDVDGRVKPGHDVLSRRCELEIPGSLANASAPKMTVQELRSLPRLHRPIGVARLRHTAIERHVGMRASQPSPFLENTMVARPGRGNGFPSS